MSDSPAQTLASRPTQRRSCFVLRHGQSEANVLGLIASSPEIGITSYGLTNEGREQVKRSLAKHRDRLSEVRQIYCSDFRRTRETAQLAAQILDVPVQQTPELRERFFGDWDGHSDDNYQRVWAADAQDPKHKKWQVESVAEVAQRMTGFVASLDKLDPEQACLLVSHGDPLQILITALLDGDLSRHRELDPLQTAEIRPL